MFVRTPNCRKASLHREKSRLGAAALETAILLPVLVVLVFGTLELTDGIFLKQSLAIGAYEGVRVASRPGATSAQARTRIDEVLAARNVSGYTVTISPDVTSTTPRGTMLSVQIVMPAGTLTSGPMNLFLNRIIQHRVRMVRL
jgi:hypothetical protein